VETVEEAVYSALKGEDKYPSVAFAMESLEKGCCAGTQVPVSALLMGTPSEIMKQAYLRKKEGFVSAKLKVGHLGVAEARSLICQLKEMFFLRIDVNRAWDIKLSIQFFSEFPYGSFDYVEEPASNPRDLVDFHVQPLAVDESFPSLLTLQDLEKIPHLKALIYKPSLQGGESSARPLYDWAVSRGISFVLSSSFESDVGLMHIAALGSCLSEKIAPVGLGTYHYLRTHLLANPPRFCCGVMTIPQMFVREVSWE